MSNIKHKLQKECTHKIIVWTGVTRDTVNTCKRNEKFIFYITPQAFFTPVSSMATYMYVKYVYPSLLLL